MARVTVEDCIEKVPNRFELVMLAVQRSRDITAGIRPSIPRDGDKNPVIALREIAESSVEQAHLWEELAAYFRMPEVVAPAAAEAKPRNVLPTPFEDKNDSDSVASESPNSVTDDSFDDDEGEAKDEHSSEDEMVHFHNTQGESSP